MRYARIAGVGSYLPEDIITNFDLEKLVETNDAWIRERTGIEQRHKAIGESTAMMAAKAGLLALIDSSWQASEVDLVVVATSSTDQRVPSVSCEVLSLIGANCGAVDVSAACTGFIYGLSYGTSLIETGRANRVLVIGADRIADFLNFSDRSTCILFGDGAGAVVLEASESPGVRDVILGADPSGKGLIRIPTNDFLTMNGREVYKFAVQKVPEVVTSLLKKNKLTVDDLDWFVPHQANDRITESVADSLGIDRQKVFSCISEIGNTSAASIPICFDRMKRQGLLQPKDLIATVGFGAGMTWGGALITW